MLTPERLEKLNYNNVIKIYDELNVDLCSEIINRISRVENISDYSKEQMRVLIERNGEDIFREVLLKTQRLDSKTKKELNKIFEKMIKDDMQGYEHLYEYRDEEFKLSKEQLKILNKGIKEVHKALQSFNSKISFAGQELYRNAIEKAYIQVVTGGKDYTSVIYNTYKELAEEGITLRDKLGRKIQLDVAVRRQVLRGIQETANTINEDVEELLGCDAVETTVSRNARPSHAEWQGQQFALTEEGAEKYNLPLWSKSDAKDELNDYNCQHTKFGIILGLDKPQYTKKELTKINNKKVKLDGKEVPVYEAEQEMRYIERNIRKYKRARDSAKESMSKTTGNDRKALEELYKKNKQNVKNWQQRYRDVTGETGLDKENERVRV